MYLSFAYFLKRRRIFLELNSKGLHPVSKREEKISLDVTERGGYEGLRSQGPHSHILMTGGSEGFFWV